MDIKIGKFTLESLTTGMYDSPKDIYREYIQNAVDSIDNAILEGLIIKGKEKIVITIDKERSFISIEDNGTGIKADLVNKFLLNIGDSCKYNTSNRGFRGIGRLAGLAYCDKLTFVTSAWGENIKTTITFNAKILRENLYSIENTLSLEEILTNVVSFKVEKEAKGKHYFNVSLENVQEIDNILSFEHIHKYISQVAPVPFSPTFKWGPIINSKMKYLGYCNSEYNIYLVSHDDKVQVYKNYQDKFVSDRVRKVEDNIEDVEEIVFYSKDGEELALLWFAKCNYLGSVQDVLIKGIRLRKGNIQLGEKSVLNCIFKDERFNGWLVGELHIVSAALIPNARRDNIEKTDKYLELLEQLKVWAEKISSSIRKISILRNNEKANKKIEEAINVGNSNLMQLNVEVVPEISLIEKQEYDEIAHLELINQLDNLINPKDCTKYKAINVQSKLNVEEKKMLEVIFDILLKNHITNADTIVSLILKQYGNFVTRK